MYGRGLVIFLLLMKAMSLDAMESVTLSSLNGPTNDLVTLLLEPQVDLTQPVEKPFDSVSVFKQQLLYHNRLPVKISKQPTNAKGAKQCILVAEIAINEPVTEMRRMALNALVEDLVSVIGTTFERVKSSGWILKAESDYYILNPLHLAIKYGLYGCAKILLSEGVNANAPDHLGRPPLHMVALLDDEELQTKLASSLLFYGAPIDAPNKSGDTALTVGVQQGNDTFVDMLLERGADPNINVQAELEALNPDVKDESMHVQRMRCASGTSPLWASVSCNKIVPTALLLRKKAQMKSAERVAAQQIHDTTQDESHKLLLAKVLATFHH